MQRLLTKLAQCLKRSASTSSMKTKKPLPMDWDTFRKMEMKYDRLIGSNSKSLLRKYLTQGLYDILKYRKTSKYGATLHDCIQSGLKHLNAEIGIYAADPESYHSFRKLFDPLLEKLQGFGAKKTHPELDYGDYCSVPNVDPHGRHVLSSRIRVARNIDGYPLAPIMTRDDYKRMERYVIPDLKRLKRDLKGWFHDEAMTYSGKRDQWIEEHMYSKPTSIMTAANIGRHFPIGRGLYYTLDKKFSIWMNFEDHMKIVSMQEGGDIGQVYRRVIKAMNALSEYITFAHDKRIGFITCNPMNVGTGLRASVLIRLVRLPDDESKFKNLLAKHHLAIRGTFGYGHRVQQGIYDISNKRNLGVTEFESVRNVCKGVKDIIRAETMAKSPCPCELMHKGKRKV